MSFYLTVERCKPQKDIVMIIFSDKTGSFRNGLIKAKLDFKNKVQGKSAKQATLLLFLLNAGDDLKLILIKHSAH